MAGHLDLPAIRENGIEISIGHDIPAVKAVDLAVNEVAVDTQLL